LPGLASSFAASSLGKPESENISFAKADNAAMAAMVTLQFQGM
jgi:hypothetical protein